MQFPDDPGVPSLYGAYLLVAGGSAGFSQRGSCTSASSASLRCSPSEQRLWGRRSGLVAAALWAVLPAGLNVLSWHGLAQVYAMGLLPVLALCTGMALRGHVGWRWALLLTCSGLATLAAHRLTALVAGVALVPLLLGAAVRRDRAGMRFLVVSIGLAAVLGAGLLVHLMRLYGRTGGPPDYRAFLERRIGWESWTRDLTWIVVTLGVAALVALIWHPRTRKDPSILVLCSLLAIPVVLSYAWVVDVPLDYARMGYYVALPLVASVGAASGRLLPRAAIALALIPILLVAWRADELGPRYRTFYQLADRTSLRGLSYMQQRSSSLLTAVVTDQCWAFLAPWLLQRPTFAALENWASG